MPSIGGLVSLAALAVFTVRSTATSTTDRFQRVHDRKEAIAATSAQLQESDASECNSTSCFKYYNSKTKPYLIEQWPDIPWNTGEFYSGSVPIDESDLNRTLFFVFKPATNSDTDEITIWLNGGPGCSSFAGFFQENGPILMQPGECKPAKNPWAWSKLTNMLWVDQPVSTGFAQGVSHAKNEVDVAKEFVKFYKNWQKIFDTQKSKIYITGESYAGRYVPYIGAQMLDEQKTSSLDLAGALVYDPCIGDCGFVQMEIPTYRFARENNGILNLNQSFLAQLEQTSTECGYEDYIDTYLQFPPPKHQPPSKNSIKNKCDISYEFEVAWNDINPCFNVYYIADFCPILSNQGQEDLAKYLNRKDVKEAIHAPKDVKWTECGGDVFHHGDHSPDSVLGALPQVIEATNRVLVGNADWDALIPTNGTLLSIQNMTWNGHLGFQKEPSEDIYVPLPYPQLEGGPQGIMGQQHYERGLQWVRTYQAGHMQPEFQPRSTWLHLEWLLGRIDKIPSSN